MKRAWQRLVGWLRSVPHLFGKVMVVWCVLCGSALSFYALRILSRTGADATGLLGVILAFLGGELAIMFARNALQNKRKDEDDNGKSV